MAAVPIAVRGSISSDADNVDPADTYNDTNAQSHEQQPLYPALLPQPQPYTYYQAEAGTGIEHKQPTESMTINHNDNDDDDGDDDGQILFEPEGIPSAHFTLPRPSYLPPPSNKSIENICKSLHSSIGLFKGKRARMRAFQSMLEHTSKHERLMINIRYQEKYQTSISRVIQRNFSGSFRQLLLYAMMSDCQLYVNEIEYALKYKNINQLTAVLCTLDNASLQIVERTFNESKRKTLKQWTDSMTSCIFYKRNINKVLLNVLNGTRSNDGNVDMKQVELDANGLHHQLKHATKQSLNKQVLIKLFTHRAFEHLYYVSLKYEQLYRQCLVDVIKPLFHKSSETGYAILLMLKFAISKYEVFSTFLGKSVHSTDHYCSFLRFLMLHYDSDLGSIIDSYGRSALDSWIKLELRTKKHADTANCVMQLCGFL